MKTPLSFYLLAAAAGTLACSSEGGTTRDRDGTGGTGQQVAQAGSAGQSNTGSAGSGNNNGGSGGGTSSGNGAPSFEITSAATNANGATATVIDSSGTSGIDGVAQLIKSPLGTVVTNGIKDGSLCMAGTTAVVPNMDYTNYWGAEIGLDLKLIDAPGGGGGGDPVVVADAGADAGGDAGSSAPPPARVATGWDPAAAGVVGFSFKVTGAKVPTAFRFKGLPVSANSADVTYCNALTTQDGATVNIRFDQITRNCWDAGGAALLTEPFQPDNPTGKLLRTISWQVPADIVVPFEFDFCVSEIKPIMGN